MKCDQLTLRLLHFLNLRSGTALMPGAAPYEKSQSDDPQDISEPENSRFTMVCKSWMNKVSEDVIRMI